MSATSEYRLKRDWCGRFVLQVKEIRHHMNDLNGSGYYDEFTTERWRNATLEEASKTALPVA